MIIVLGILLTGTLFTLFSLAKVSFGPKGTGAVLMICILLCITATLFSYALETISTTYHRMNFWMKAEYAGSAFYPSLFLMFIYQFTRKRNYIFTYLLVITLLISSLLFLSRITNEYHWLFYTSATFNPAGPLPVMVTEKGPLYLIFMVYINLLIIFSLYLLISYHSKVIGTYRTRSALMIPAVVLPWAAYILYLLKLVPAYLDPLPFALIPATVIFHLCFMSYRLFSISPIARDSIFEQIEEAIAVFDHKLHLIDFNNRISEVFPDINLSAIGSSAEMLFTQDSIILKMLENLSDGEPEDLTKILELGNKRYQIKMSPIHGRVTLKGISIMLHDITENYLLMKELERLAVTDPLTDIFNRRKITDLLDSECTRSSRYNNQLSVIMYDLDHFKQVNDQFGHAFGDEVLITIAEIIGEQLRATDSLGRIGGDEFFIILPETPLASAKVLADRLCEKISLYPFSVNRRIAETRPGKKIINHDFLKPYREDMQVTVSMGIAEASGKDASGANLLAQADSALYLAKRRGKNQACTFQREIEVENLHQMGSDA